jgi:predicted AAA+ superfamily ATPase
MDTLYFKRHLETVLKQCVKQTKVLIVIGPRQVGKTTLLKEILSKEADYTYVSLDDDDVKKQAISDPKFFLNQFKTPLMIDEIQKAPNLFEYIKFYVDKKDEYGQYILTGSEAFPIMQGVKDSLSTRCLIVDMQSLSYSEITNKTNFHFIPDKFKMIERKCDAITPYEIFTNIIKGSMPEVNKNPLPNIYFFYKTYCQTVFKDITDDIIKIKDL